MGHTLENKLELFTAACNEITGNSSEDIPELDQKVIDANLGVKALMSGDVDDLAGRQASGAAAGAFAINQSKAQEEKAKQRATDLLYMDLLQQIGALENQLAEQYGENFAEDLFADLHQQGLIDGDAYQSAMAIEDDKERRQAIALLIQQGLDDGTITMADLEGHPWAADWLDLHEQETNTRDREAQRGLDGDLAVDEISMDAQYEAAKVQLLSSAPNLASAFEMATVEAGQRTDQDANLDQTFSNFDLSNMNDLS